jgi:hypothetical protein
VTLVKGAKKNSKKGFSKAAKAGGSDKQKAAIAIAVKKSDGKIKRKEKGK